MTTEDDFQRALDKNPEDWQTRLVFADWLQERGDVRAEGYRALGATRRTPNTGSSLAYQYTSEPEQALIIRQQRQYMLPLDWYKLADPEWDRAACGPFFKVSRREAEDTAARAFTKLPAARRAELLSQGVVA